jgi:hypothetical protein
MKHNLDLFGDPVSPNHGRRGRPAHIATRENRNKVLMLLALGWTNQRIGSALAIDLKTFRKNYSHELKLRDFQRDRLDAAVAMKLWDQVQEGNVGAIKEFRALLERNDLMRRPLESEDHAQKLGKKEQALLDAQIPDTGTTLGELMAKRQGQPIN